MTDEAAPVLPEIDYLSKDYASFRQVILNHLTTRVPAWKETSEADVGNVIVEILAYAADYLSYYQDAVATEAYLGTARRRPSIKRHARLLDYRLHEGCNARVWVYIAVSQDSTLPQGTPCVTQVNELAGVPILAPGSPAYNDALAQELAIFETMQRSELFAAHNEMRFFVRDGQEASLAAGSTSATLYAPGAELSVGQVLLFEEVKGITTGDPLDADPSHRHAVRLTRVLSGYQQTTPVVTVEWAVDDALPSPLVIATRCDGEYIGDISVARGNMVLADYGRSVFYEQLPPVGDEQRYHPHLLLHHLTHCVPFEGEQLPRACSARQALLQNPVETLPAITLFKRDDIGSVTLNTTMQLSLLKDSLPDELRQRLYQGKGLAFSANVEVDTIYNLGWVLRDAASKQCVLLIGFENKLGVSVLKEWTPRRDLISSVPLVNTYCVDMEESGKAYLRFCTEDLGEPPDTGTNFVATYRVGRGVKGNIQSDTIAHAVINDENIIQVRNPLAAQGGINPQSVEEARLQAPLEFQAQQRCVTETDFGEITCRHPQVTNAVAQLRWSGYEYTMFVYVQRTPGLPVDATFKAEIARYLEDFRITGYDVEVCAPAYVAIEIMLKVFMKPDYYTNVVHTALIDAFDTSTTGFFSPTNFTFGQTVYLSQIIARAMKVRGVARVEVERFRRLDTPEPPQAGVEQITLHPLEIIRLDNNPHAPNNGSIVFHIEGGL